MSSSNLEVYKANRANEISELKVLTKYRLDEINKIKERKDIVKKLVNTLLLLIMQTKFLLHYQHRLAL